MEKVVKVLICFVTCVYGNDIIGEALNDCAMKSKIRTYCYDFGAMAECLRVIPTTSTRDKHRVSEFESQFVDERAVQKACPGLDHSKTCAQQVAWDCIDNLQTLAKQGNAKACDELPPSRACLSQLQASCPRVDVVSQQMRYLNPIDRQCRFGRGLNGPCRFSATMECKSILYKYSKIEEKGEYSVKSCTIRGFREANKCLEDLKAKCTRPEQLDFIREEIYDAGALCPM